MSKKQVDLTVVELSGAECTVPFQILIHVSDFHWFWIHGLYLEVFITIGKNCKKKFSGNFFSLNLYVPYKTHLGKQAMIF